MAPTNEELFARAVPESQPDRRDKSLDDTM